MAKLIIHGFPPSSYTWTARAICAVKGVDYDFDITPPQVIRTPDYINTIHPYSKVPALTHGDVHFYETLAIGRYVDAAFDGPALQPTTPADIGKMAQWISIANAYFYAQVVPAYVFEYIFPKGEGGTVRKDKVAEALPAIQKTVNLMNEALADGPFILGASISLADLFIGPLLFGLANLPEGKEMVAAAPNVARLRDALLEVDGFMSSAPTREG